MGLFFPSRNTNNSGSGASGGGGSAGANGNGNGKGNGNGNGDGDNPVDPANDGSGNGPAQEVPGIAEQFGFYNNMSFGLRHWGPLIPFGDRTDAILLLSTTQLALGIGLYRFGKRTTIPLQTRNHLNVFNQSKTRIFLNTLFKTPFVLGGGYLILLSGFEYARLTLPYDPLYEQAKVSRSTFEDYLALNRYNSAENPMKAEVKEIFDFHDTSILSQVLVNWHGPLYEPIMTHDQWLTRYKIWLKRKNLVDFPDLIDEDILRSRMSTLPLIVPDKNTDLLLRDPKHTRAIYFKTKHKNQENYNQILASDESFRNFLNDRREQNQSSYGHETNVDSLEPITNNYNYTSDNYKKSDLEEDETLMRFNKSTEHLFNTDFDRFWQRIANPWVMLKWETSYKFQAIPKSPIYAYEDVTPKKEEITIQQSKLEDAVPEASNAVEETVADSFTNPKSKNTPPQNNNNDNDNNSISKLSSANRNVKNDGSENSSENVSANNTQ